MKHRSWILVLFLPCLLWTASPARQPEYNITVHVTASRSVKQSENAPRHQHLDVTIDGKKYELESVLGVHGLLNLGDYRARLSTDDHDTNGHDSHQVYEFQFPDKRTREFLVVGQLE
jgi:hypothetical protein